MLGGIPFIKNKLNNLAPEPDIWIGNYKGLYYRINEEVMECTDFVYNILKLEGCQFTKVYNEKFKTNKFKPFVLKWVSFYVFELLTCLYRAHLDKPSKKVLYLRNNLLNRQIYEWWSRKTGNKIQVRWLGESEAKAGLEAITSILALFIYNLLSHGLCLPVRPKKFKIMKEAVWGLRSRVFRDDFFVDNEKLLKKDLLLYTFGSSQEPRMSAYKAAQDSEYECINKSKLKIPVNLLFQRLFKYHFRLPLVFVLSNFSNKQNYMLKDWLKWFHAVAIDREILLSHYQIGLDLSVNETSLVHIPETIILNNYGAKSVIYHWSDMTSGAFSTEHFKSFNIYLIWGKAHIRGKQYFVDNIIETGCWLKHNFGEFTKDKKNIHKKLELPTNGYKVLAFYDESFAPNIHFSEEVLLDFWQMMFELIEENRNVIGIMKPKVGDGDKRLMLSAKGKEIYNNIKQRCSESGRFYFIDNPREVGVTEVIAISDINITMGMGSPSSIALLCGKIGLYYNTPGDDYHPFARKYKNKVVFDNKRGLFSAVNKIINQGYSPLDEIDEELLRDYDQFRDERGLERFREALLDNL
ncbi:MAG: hypothetical protein CL875_03055 [Dehalococcoidales bacterium]|jgi:hypothetical protein|nr:hypothetical protein [Dehalococcoidales bacterium]MAF85449.1 hypothetical protein [Dehalococcoidales bacterium]